MSLDQASFSYPVSWSDFIDKSSRPAGEDEDAYIKVRFPFSYNLGRAGNAIKITSVDMKLEVTSESWAVSSEETNDLLKHEQRHYDITAIGARELYNKLLTLTAKTEHDLTVAKKNENDNFQKKINDVNKRYDKQTDHSQDAAKQDAWNKAIAAEKQKPDGSLVNLPP